MTVRPIAPSEVRAQYMFDWRLAQLIRSAQTIEDIDRGYARYWRYLKRHGWTRAMWHVWAPDVWETPA